MRLKTLYIRFYKSFNYDYLRKSHPGAEGEPWDLLSGSGEDEDLFYPFVRVPLEDDITTVVGANESGKSQLLTAIECLLTGKAIERRDFCRYSDFFTVGAQMKLPEFGGEFADLDTEEGAGLRAVLGLGADSKVSSFHMFRLNGRTMIYVPDGESEDGWRSAKLKADEVKKIRLPTYFSIDSKTPLPDSVPLSYLTATSASKRARPRRQILGWLETMLANHDWFGTKETINSNVASLLAEHESLVALDGETEQRLISRLELAEKLLVQVAGIGREAFAQLQDAVKSHDGYANAIVAKMNDELAAALNFPKWWSQDIEFSLFLTLRDFDLVFTVRDRTGSEYAFGERSGGLSYFLSYFVQYLSHEPAGGAEILLMDEPDAYLSMLGQQDLLQIFDAFANPESPSNPAVQVVYVTHSPFLVDKNHSERIRVLEKGAGDEGTRLVANAGRNHYEPLRSAFGAFVAETAFISGCNLMLEGQADQVLLAGISSLARRTGSTGATLDLNTLSLVPSGSAEHIPYMAYLARGRDVDKPAVVVLLDGDDEGTRIAAELAHGYRGKKYVEDDLVLRTDSLPSEKVAVDTDAVREIEDLIPRELAVLAVKRFASEVLSAVDAEAFSAQFDNFDIPPGEKLFKSAQTACDQITPALRLDKVGFARAVVAATEHDAESPLREQAIRNFTALFDAITLAQASSIRRNDRERVSRTVGRFKRAFLRDHRNAPTRRTADVFLGDIEAQLTEVTDETEAVRSAIRLLRRDFALREEPAAVVTDYNLFTQRLEELTYHGVRDVQQSSWAVPESSGN